MTIIIPYIALSRIGIVIDDGIKVQADDKEDFNMSRRRS